MRWSDCGFDRDDPIERDEPPYKRCSNPGAHPEHVWRDRDRGLFECDGDDLGFADAWAAVSPLTDTPEEPQ